MLLRRWTINDYANEIPYTIPTIKRVKTWKQKVPKDMPKYVAKALRKRAKEFEEQADFLDHGNA